MGRVVELPGGGSGVKDRFRVMNQNDIDDATRGLRFRQAALSRESGDLRIEPGNIIVVAAGDSRQSTVIDVEHETGRTIVDPEGLRTISSPRSDARMTCTLLGRLITIGMVQAQA